MAMSGKKLTSLDYHLKDSQHESSVARGNNYFLGDGTLENSERNLAGRWADPFGLVSKNLNGQMIDREVFEHVMNGRDPFIVEIEPQKKNRKTGKITPASVGNKKLVRNAGEEGRTLALDITFSPPKDLDLLFIVVETDLEKRQIERIHNAAVDAAVKYILEELVVTRRGAGGKIEEKAQGMCAILDHKTARPVDGFVAPQIHSHCLFSGMVRGQDGKMLAMDESRIMNWRSAAENIYHAEYARGLQEFGAEIVVEKGHTACRVKGIEQFQAALDALSLRSEQIKENLKTQANGKERHELSRAEESKAVLHDRSSKLELEREVLDASWEKAVNDAGTSYADVRNWMKNLAANKQERPEFSMTQEEIVALREQIAAELHEKDSTFKESVLYGKIGFYLQGRGVREDIDHLFAQMKGGLIPLGYDWQGNHLYASEAQVAMERRMVEQAKPLTPHHILDRQYVDALIASKQTPELKAKNRAMTDAQAHAVREMLCGHGAARLVGISEGSAGAGKSFSADTLREAYEGQGRTVVGLCIGWKQAKNLEKEARLEQAKAITGWLNDVEKGHVKLTPKTVILLDEGGLIDSKNMSRIISAAHDAGAKIVLTGDTRQLNAIGGAAMKTLANELSSTRIGETAEEIMRQKNPAYAQAGLDIAKSGGKISAKAAVDVYRENGRFTISKNRDESMDALVAAVKEGKAANPDKSQIIIANTRADVRKLNEKLREMKKGTGEITGPEFDVRCGDGETVSYMAKLAVGEVIQFRKNQKEDAIWNRDTGTITKIGTALDESGKNQPIFYVRLENGKETSFSPIPGDPHFSEKTGALAIEHAHASSIFSSQGATVDEAFVFDAANLDRRLAYVAMTRFRGEEKIIDGEKVHSKEGVKVFLDRQSSHERIVQSDDWRPASKITDEEIFQNVVQRWTRSEEKLSTYDLLKKSTYDLSRSDEENAVTVDTIRRENEQIINSAQLTHAANREYAAFEQREKARQSELSLKQKQEPNHLNFDHNKEYSYAQLVAAREVGLYQSHFDEARRKSAPQSLSSLRHLSELDVVQRAKHAAAAPLPLREDASHHVDDQRAADHAVRREGAGDHRTQNETTEGRVKQDERQPIGAQPPVEAREPERDFSGVTIFLPPQARPDLRRQLDTAPIIFAASKGNAESIAANELSANQPATVVVIEDANDVALRYPAIREAIQNPYRQIVFAGDINESTRDAVMRIAAEKTTEKTETAYRDLVRERGERDNELTK